MIDYIKLLYEITEKAINKGNEKEVLQNFIVFEAKHNLDLIDIARRIKDNALKFEVIGKLETNSIEIFKIGNIQVSKILQDGGKEIIQAPNDSEKRTLDHYNNKSEKYLYEFCIRKSIALKNLSQCDVHISNYIKVDTRLKNLSFAYRSLLIKLHNI